MPNEFRREVSYTFRVVIISGLIQKSVLISGLIQKIVIISGLIQKTWACVYKDLVRILISGSAAEVRNLMILGLEFSSTVLGFRILLL